MKKALALILVFALSAIAMSSCAVSGDISRYGVVDYMKNITPAQQTPETLDSTFRDAYADFALRLYGEVKKEKNTLISPLSVMLALAMTANGADGATLEGMEKALGGIKIDKLNAYLKSYVDSLPSGDSFKISIANSIWFRKDAFEPSEDFLQKVCDFYSPDIYGAPFDSSTVNAINSWVNGKTDGMIKKMLEEIDYESVMFLINAICFDCKWESKFNPTDTQKNALFRGSEGTVSCDLMTSKENTYIKGEGVTGFIKKYRGGKYAFAAFLPDDSSVTPDEWLAGMSGDRLVSLLESSTNGRLLCRMPKFGYEYACNMNDALKTLGMEEAFDSHNARFISLGKNIRDGSNVCIGKVTHKTFIKLDEEGTKAAAATMVDMTAESAEMPPEIQIILDRPFAYAIIDTETNLPIFIGTVNTID